MGEAIEKLFDEKKHDQLPEIPIGGATDDPQDQANWDAFDKWIHHQGPAPHFRAAHSTPSDTAVSDITAKTNDSDSVSGECLHAQNDWKPYQTIKCYKRQQCPSQPTPSGGWMPCWGWKTYQIDYFIPEVQNLVQKTNNLIRDINNGKEIKIQDIEEIRKLFQQVHRTVSVRNVPNDFNYEFISVIDSILQQIHIDLARKMQIHEDKELESISIVEADPFHHPWIPIGTLISGPRTVAVEMQIPLWIDDNRMLAWVRHNAFGNWQANLFFFDCENSVYAVMTGLGFGSDQLPPKGSLLDLALRRIEKARAQKSPSLLDMERNLQVSSSLREVQRGTEESLSLQHLCH
jgi:hypothetical protein